MRTCYLNIGGDNSAMSRCNIWDSSSTCSHNAPDCVRWKYRDNRCIAQFGCCSGSLPGPKVVPPIIRGFSVVVTILSRNRKSVAMKTHFAQDPAERPPSALHPRYLARQTGVIHPHSMTYAVPGFKNPGFQSQKADMASRPHRQMPVDPYLHARIDTFKMQDYPLVRPCFRNGDRPAIPCPTLVGFQ